MSFKFNKLFNFVLLFIFLSTTLFINFMHTEHSVHSSNSCPACHFQNSTATTNFFISFCLPQLTLLEILHIFDSFSYNQPNLTIPLSRAPPQV